MPKALDLTNQRFGKLLALEKAPSRSGKTYWKCRCECGTIKEVQTGYLKSGAIQSCGCNAHQVKQKIHPVISFRRRIKVALVEAFKHKCAYCGLEDDVALYDFHHIYPETKSFGIADASTTRSKQAYLEEAKKCVMLYANCHRKIENNLISIADLVPITVNEEVYFQTLEDLLK